MDLQWTHLTPRTGYVSRHYARLVVTMAAFNVLVQ